MLIWTVAVALILVSPFLFPEEYLVIFRKILRWTRKAYEQRFGKEKTLRELGEPNEFEI